MPLKPNCYVLKKGCFNWDFRFLKHTLQTVSNKIYDQNTQYSVNLIRVTIKVNLNTKIITK